MYISGTGTLIVQLNIAPLGAPNAAGLVTLGEGAPTTDIYVGQNGSESLYESAAANELLTGQHAAASDTTITFNAQLLSSVTSVQSYYLVSVFEHELMHGFGMSGFRSQTGSIGPLESTFDSLSVLQPNGSDVFTGAAAEYVYGGPVPLTTQLPGSNYYHLGATGTSADPFILYSDIMDPVAGPGRVISQLDVAILDDLGIPLTAAGYELYDPYPTVTASSLSVAGASVADPDIYGATQPGEQVTLILNGTVLASTIASSTGFWSIDPTALADGSYTLVVSTPDATATDAVNVSITLDATDPVEAIYQQILNRAADPAALTALRQQLVDGESVAAARAGIAGSAEAAMDIGQIYSAILGRWVDQAGLVASVAAFAAGAGQTTLRTTVANSAESANDIGRIYAAALGRWVDPSGLSGSVNFLSAGGAQAGLRTSLADSAEAAAAITGLYTAILGRPASSTDLTNCQAYLAAGGSLTALSSTLGYSAEATTAITGVFEAILDRAPSTTDLSGWRIALAAGASLTTLRTELATGTESAADIGSFAQNVLGQPLSSAAIAAYQQQEVTGASLQQVETQIVTSPAAVAAIDAVYTAQAVTLPNAVELAGVQSELVSGVSLTTVGLQVAELNGGSPPVAIPGAFIVDITPVTLGSTSPSFIYGLQNDDALQAAAPETVTLNPGGVADITGFNPLTDIIQVRSQQAANFAAIQNETLPGSGNTFIVMHHGGDIFLTGISPSQLAASNFRFV